MFWFCGTFARLRSRPDSEPGGSHFRSPAAGHTGVNARRPCQFAAVRPVRDYECVAQTYAAFAPHLLHVCVYSAPVPDFPDMP